MTDPLTRSEYALRVGTIALGSGLFLGLIATVTVGALTRSASEAAEAACEARHGASQRDVRKLTVELTDAKHSLGLQQARTQLFAARLLLGQASTELALDNFGIANDRLQEAARVLEAIDAADGGMEPAEVRGVREQLGSTHLEVTGDTPAQLKLLGDLSGALERLAPRAISH